MSKAIIVDLDGTLCDIDHRVHHLNKDKKDWKSFYENLHLDKLNKWCRELILAMKDKDIEIILLTGRDDLHRVSTEKWLDSHEVPYKFLHMRNQGDFRSDCEVKMEIYNNEIKDNFNVLFVVEDRASVVKMWRDIGVVCLQCDWGDF